jgi:hypothetical protein
LCRDVYEDRGQADRTIPLGALIARAVIASTFPHQDDLSSTALINPSHASFTAMHGNADLLATIHI